MNLIRRVANANPFALTSMFDEDFERLFQTACVDPEHNIRLSPNIDVIEDENEFRVEAELPGLSAKDFTVEAVEGSLMIKGEKSRETNGKQGNYAYRERSFGAFQRWIRLPRTVQPDKIEATLKDGVLTVRIPKREEVKPRAIKVEVGK